VFVVSDQRLGAVVAFSGLDADGAFGVLRPPPAIGGMHNPAGLALAEEGTVVVADRDNGRVLVLFTASLTWVELGSGSLNRPTGVAVLPDGRVAVADSRRVLALGLDGSVEELVAMAQGFVPVGVAEAGGRLYRRGHTG